MLRALTRFVSCSSARRPLTTPQVFFCNSGTEANEGALKIARKYQLTRSGAETQTLFECGKAQCATVGGRCHCWTAPPHRTKVLAFKVRGLFATPQRIFLLFRHRAVSMVVPWAHCQQHTSQRFATRSLRWCTTWRSRSTTT